MPKPNSPTAFTDHVSTVSASTTNANNTLWYNALTNYVLFNDVADTITVAHTFNAGANFANGTFDFAGGTVANLTTASPTFTGTVLAAALTASGLATLNGGLVVGGNGTISGSWTANSLAVASTATINGLLEVSTAGATGIARLTSTGGSGRSWDLRSNTSGLLTIVDVTGAQTWISLASTGALTLNGALGVTGATTLTTVAASASTSSVVGQFIQSGATNGYGVQIKSEGTASTRYALRLTNLAESVTYLTVQTETGKVGYVGIGTDTPTSLLTVNGTVSFAAFNGQLLPDTTATWDLGATGTRWANLYLSGGATIGGALGVTGVVTATAGVTAPLTGIVNVGTGTGAAGRIYKTATNGTIIRLAGGSATDFAILDPSGNAIATVAAGTVNARFEGTITTPGNINCDTATALKFKGGQAVGSASQVSGSATTNTVLASGTDTAGLVSFNVTGTGSWVVRVNYGVAYNPTGFVVVCALGAFAQAVKPYISSQAAGYFEISGDNFGSTGTPSFVYHVFA